MRNIEPKSMTKTERMHGGYRVGAIKKTDYELLGHLTEFTALPRAWYEIWQDDDRRDPKRTHVTIRLDADVVKYFGGMVEGYQVRINRVLRAYMHFRLAKLIEGPDTMDFVLRPEEVLERAAVRPEWGDTERDVEGFIASRKGENADEKKKAAERSEAARTLGTGARKRELKGTTRGWSLDPLDGRRGGGGLLTRNGLSSKD